MKKGKKMPSIELDGQSEAKFVLVDGKITRVEGTPTQQPPEFQVERLDRR